MLDCSVALAWAFPDEASALADRVLQHLRHGQAYVPNLWRIEVSNAMAVGERRGQLTSLQIEGFLERLSELSIVVDHETGTYALTTVLGLARTQKLTAYDACYLELAIRKKLPLASLDTDLRRAAARRGVDLADR